MGCHFLLQGIFLTQGFEPASPVFPALQADSLPLEPLGKPSLSIFSYFLYSWDFGICGLPDIRVCFSQSQPILRDSKELNQSMPFVYKPTNSVMLSFPFIIISVPLFMQVQAQWPGNYSRGGEPENIFHSGLCMYDVHTLIILPWKLRVLQSYWHLHNFEGTMWQVTQISVVVYIWASNLIIELRDIEFHFLI